MIVRFLTICFVLFCSLSCETALQTELPPRPTVAPKAQVIQEHWAWGSVEGTRIVTEGWDIKTSIPHDHIIRSLPFFYESLLKHYSTIFGELPYPEERLEVFLFSSEEEWQEKIEDLLGDEARQWEGLGKGGLTIGGTAILFHLDRRGRSRSTFRIAAHEGWHQYAESILQDTLPTWLDEGIGTWMEGFRVRRDALIFQPASNWDRLSTLRTIVASKQLTPLKDLLAAEPSELLSQGRGTLLGYYAQLWAFTSFLMEYDDGRYRPALRKILLDALEGRLREPTRHIGWLFAFTNNPEQLESQYLQWVENFVKPGTSWR